MVRVDKSSIVSMERVIWMYFTGTEWRYLETASSSSMMTSVAPQLADKRLQAEGEVLHRLTILELEVGILLLQ